MQNSDNQISNLNNNRKILRKTQMKKQLSEYLHICECGRQFLSFPAIYSHAKTKHNLRISSRIGDSHRKLYVQNNQNKIYYQILDINHQQYQNDGSNSEVVPLIMNPKQTNSKFNFLNKIKKFQTSEGVKNIYGTTVEFLNYCTNKINRKDFQMINQISQTLDSLTECINQHYMHFDSQKIYTNYCSQNTAQNIPLYFNFYIIWYLPSHDSLLSEDKKSKSYTLLKIFFKWLKDHKITELECQKNQSFEQNQTGIEQNFFRIQQAYYQYEKGQKQISSQQRVNEYKQQNSQAEGDQNYQLI